MAPWYRLARTRNEADVAQKKLAAVNDSSTEAEIVGATRQAEHVIQQIRFDEDSVARRRNETLMFGGSALAVLALGTFLFLYGRKQQKQRQHTGTAAPRSVAA